MKEYIAKKKVIEAIEKAVAPEITTIGDYETIGVFTRESIERIVSNLLADDVVEVVRCKNCRFFSGRQECYCHAADENGTPIFVREDDFCSYGARMGKEDEIYG